MYASLYLVSWSSINFIIVPTFIYQTLFEIIFVSSLEFPIMSTAARLYDHENQQIVVHKDNSAVKNDKAVSALTNGYVSNGALISSVCTI